MRLEHAEVPVRTEEAWLPVLPPGGRRDVVEEPCRAARSSLRAARSNPSEGLPLVVPREHLRSEGLLLEAQRLPGESDGCVPSFPKPWFYSVIQDERGEARAPSKEWSRPWSLRCLREPSGEVERLREGGEPPGLAERQFHRRAYGA